MYLNAHKIQIVLMQIYKERYLKLLICESFRYILSINSNLNFLSSTPCLQTINVVTLDKEYQRPLVADYENSPLCLHIVLGRQRTREILLINIVI